MMALNHHFFMEEDPLSCQTKS